MLARRFRSCGQAASSSVGAHRWAGSECAHCLVARRQACRDAEAVVMDEKLTYVCMRSHVYHLRASCSQCLGLPTLLAALRVRGAVSTQLSQALSLARLRRLHVGWGRRGRAGCHGCRICRRQQRRRRVGSHRLSCCGCAHCTVAAGNYQADVDGSARQLVAGDGATAGHCNQPAGRRGG